MKFLQRPGIMTDPPAKAGLQTSTPVVGLAISRLSAPDIILKAESYCDGVPPVINWETMEVVKPKKAPEKLAENSRLSPKELRRLADKLVATKDPAEVSRLKKLLERGFYGDTEHA